MANYIYSSSTANNNLQNHLYKHHAAVYDQMVADNNWPYSLSTHTNDVRSHKNAGNVCVRDWAVPQFSAVAFLESLVSFIVTDDQVSPKILHSSLHSHVFSRFVLLNALNSTMCVWSSATPLLTQTSLAMIG